MTSGWIIVLVSFGLVAGYTGLVFYLARRWRVRWPPIETVIRELPRPGHHICLFHLPPERARFREPVILCHGLGANRFNVDFVDDGRGRERSSLARALCRAGFDVWVLELRGHGEARVPAGADWTVDDQVREDVTEAIQTVLALTEASSVLWVGHSWGGLLQVLFQVRGLPLAGRVKAVVAIGSPFTMRLQPSLTSVEPYLRWWLEIVQRPLPLRLLARLVLPIVVLWPRWPRAWSAPLAPMAPGVVRGILASMTEDIPVGILRQLLGWIQTGKIADARGRPDEQIFDRLTTPTLLVAGAKDHVAPPAAMAWLRDRAGEDVVLKIMGRGTGCAADYGHGGLLLSDRAPDEVYPLVRAWLAARATPLRRRIGIPKTTNGGFLRGGFDQN